MAITVIRDGWAWRARAVHLAAREVEAAPHLWSAVTLFTMSAWLLRQAGALTAEIAVWTESTPALIERLLDEFEAQLALGTPEAREARARLAVLAAAMGEIVAEEAAPVVHEAEIIAFPAGRMRRAVMVRELRGGAE